MRRTRAGPRAEFARCSSRRTCPGGKGRDGLAAESLGQAADVRNRRSEANRTDGVFYLVKWVIGR